ncbi:MAG: DUF7594 domain-containing protein [Bryobacteraceae bacterium]
MFYRPHLQALWILALVAHYPIRAETAVLECTADTWVRTQSTAENGPARALKVQGRKEFALLRFRTAAIEGWNVSKATLWLHPLGTPAQRLRIAAAVTDWNEGEAPKIALRPGRAFRATRLEGGWITIALDPALASSPKGLILTGADSKPYQFDSRETVGHAPYLVVEGARTR